MFFLFCCCWKEKKNGDNVDHYHLFFFNLTIIIINKKQLIQLIIKLQDWWENWWWWWWSTWWWPFDDDTSNLQQIFHTQKKLFQLKYMEHYLCSTSFFSFKFKLNWIDEKMKFRNSKLIIWMMKQSEIFTGRKFKFKLN